MPSNTEIPINVALSDQLCRRNPKWVRDKTVFVEWTDMIRGKAGHRPDILVDVPDRQVVVVETEVEPGRDVDAEAKGRLMEVTTKSGKKIESSISVVMPDGLRSCGSGLETSEFRLAIHSVGREGRKIRDPADTKEYFTGNIDMLSSAIEYASTSSQKLRKGMEILDSVTLRAGSILREGVPSQVLLDIASDVHQPESKQTTDMAIAILLNAVVFHFSIEGHPDIPMGDRIRKQKFSKSSVLESWEQILQVNYWAIFAIANRILQRIPARTVPDIFNVLVSGAEELVSLGASSFHDLSGRMFQKLISDRKFLASFYTLPTAAQLLAELSVSSLNIDWSDPRAILSLRVADFACGTGALLAAVQRDCYIRYRREGGDDIDIHQKMIEQCLIGTDIMPAATHVTASMLASPHPSCIHKDSGIHTLAWGREEDDVYLGALELLENIYAPSLFSPDAVQMSGVPKKNGGGGDFSCTERVA